MPRNRHPKKDELNPIQEFVARRRLHKIGIDAATVDTLGKAFLTAGGEYLVREHGFTTEQVGKWAVATIAGARKILLPETED